MRTIKRYPNRKLDDLERKQYVTLDDIFLMVQEGLDIQVIDHESGEDLTGITLSQIIFEREKKRPGSLPKSILTTLIRTSTAPIDYFKKSVTTSVGALHLLENEVDKRIEALVSRGELADDEAEALRQDMAGHSGVRGLLPDLSLNAALSKLNVPTHADIKALEQQVEKLMMSVDKLLAASDVARTPDSDQNAEQVEPDGASQH